MTPRSIYTPSFFWDSRKNLPWEHFESYCADLAEHIPALAPHYPELPASFLSERLPFQCGPIDSDVGVLMIHGFSASPKILERWAQGLATHARVHSILLPGHGTVPGDLLSVRHEDWWNLCVWALKDLRKRVRKVFLFGFSLGGALVLKLGECFPVDGLILLSPVHRIHSSFAGLSGLFARAPFSRLRWLMQLAENDVMRYRSMPYYAIAQVYDFLKALPRAESYRVPILNFSSLEDEVVRGDLALSWFLKHPHPESRMLLYTRKGVSVEDPRVTVRMSGHPEHRILDYSHVALTHPLDDPIYGIDSPNPSVQQIWGLKKTGPICRGSLSLRNLIEHRMRFLTASPYFEDHVQRALSFLQDDGNPND